MPDQRASLEALFHEYRPRLRAWMARRIPVALRRRIDQLQLHLFDLHADLTSYTGQAGHRQVDRGDVELHVGASSMDIRATLLCTLTGSPRKVGFDRVAAPTVTLG